MIISSACNVSGLSAVVIFIPEIYLAAQGTTFKEGYHYRKIWSPFIPIIQGYEIPVVIHPIVRAILSIMKYDWRTIVFKPTWRSVLDKAEFSYRKCVPGAQK